ncbi:hypothetical protein C7271_12320 [filamentous cyanobacterium CCP5]|nr:hypothetical protein C7271_12320 [filamentous cyanobacterium CCP5]
MAMTNPTPTEPEVSTNSPAASARHSLSPAAWGALSAIAVAVIGGLVTVATTVIPLRQDQPKSPPPEKATLTTDAIAGKWTGIATADNGDRYTLSVAILPDCEVGDRCGTIAVAEVPCYGEISLYGVAENTFEFNVDQFDHRSSASCSPGAGEHFHLLPDGRLAYQADWGVEGILAAAR